MPDERKLIELLAVTSFGGVGIAIALASIVAGRLFLPKDQRKSLRLPLLLLALHAGTIAAQFFLPAGFVFGRALRVLAVAFLLFSIGRSALLLMVHAMTGRRGSVPPPRILQDILQALIYMAIALIVLRAAGVELSSILTTSALLTAVIGLSLQETLGNLFAGLAIQAQRPFEIGDWIQLDNENASIGRVVEINWRATRVLTVENIEITIPNGALARASIRNHSKPTPEVRRSVTIVVSAEAPPADVQRIFLEAVRGTPGTLETPSPDVQTIGFGDRGVEYRVRFWTVDLSRRDPVDGAVRDRLWYALQRAGLGVPASQRHVFVHETSDQIREERQSREAAERAQTLRYVDLFHDLTADALSKLASSSDRRMYMTGETVIQEGSEGDELFVVESGEVEVSIAARDGSGGPSAKLATLGPGRFFGEMSLMTGEKRRATVRTTRPSVLLAVGKSDLQPLLEAHPELAERISGLLAERENALGQAQGPDQKERQSMVAMRSDALLARIRDFFGL